MKTFERRDGSSYARDEYTGEVYDTATAIRVGTLASDVLDVTDLDYYDATIYRTPSGAYFAAGEGGARTMFVRSQPLGGVSGGRGIVPIDESDLYDIAGEPVYEPVEG